MDADATARGWAAVRRGLGWVQAAVFFKILALAACPGIELARQYGARLPDQETGFLKVAGLSQANEIRLLAVAVPAVLAVLCAVVGRFGAASAPRSSFGRGIAAAAAWFTLFAALGFAATATITGLAVASGSVPRVVPGQDVVKPDVRFQERVERYIDQVFVMPGDASGQAQRVGLLAVIVFGLVAEVWFLNALGRYAAALQSPGAAGRITTYLVLVGGLFALGLVGLLVYDLAGKEWVATQVLPKWNGLDAKARTGIIYGGFIAAVLILAFLYYRMLGGVKRAIRESYDGVPVG
jgi:hypothetical protein